VTDGHHLVAWTDADRAQGEVQGRRPRRDHAGVARIHERLELTLEGLDLGALHDPARSQDALHGRFLLGTEERARDRDRAPAHAAW
jgi:hypothetical protein